MPHISLCIDPQIEHVSPQHESDLISKRVVVELVDAEKHFKKKSSKEERVENQ